MNRYRFARHDGRIVAAVSFLPRYTLAYKYRELIAALVALIAWLAFFATF